MKSIQRYVLILELNWPEARGPLWQLVIERAFFVKSIESLYFPPAYPSYDKFCSVIQAISNKKEMGLKESEGLITYFIDQLTIPFNALERKTSSKSLKDGAKLYLQEFVKRSDVQGELKHRLIQVLIMIGDLKVDFYAKCLKTEDLLYVANGLICRINLSYNMQANEQSIVLKKYFISVISRKDFNEVMSTDALVPVIKNAFDHITVKQELLVTMAKSPCLYEEQWLELM